MLNVLVIGSGNYVCGRGTAGFGTILPALCEWKRRGHELNTVMVSGTRADGVTALKAKLEELEERMGVQLQARCLPDGRHNDPQAYRKALRDLPRPACAIVVVPDALHAEITTRVMEAGIHVLVVKPLAPTVDEVLRLLDTQKRHRVYAAVEFHKRWDAANLMLRDAVVRGLIGEPQYFVVEYSQRKEIPAHQFKVWAETTNSFQYLGVHYVDIIYFVTGARPVRVAAVGQRGWLAATGIDTCDSVQVMVEWQMLSGSKFASTFLTNWVDPAGTSALSDQRIKVIGTKGRFESDQKRRGIQVVSDDQGTEEPNPDFCLAYQVPGCEKIAYRGYGIESVHTFLKDVTRIAEKDIDPADLEGQRPTFRDALVSTAVVEAANHSLAKDGQWVDVQLPASW